MTQLYIPQLKDCIRLTAPLNLVRPDWDRAYTNEHPIWNIERPDQPWDYKAAEELMKATLVEGTVLQFKRYFISTHANADVIKVAIFAHPNPLLTPRRNGGRSKHTIELELPVSVFNRIEYEKVVV